MSRSGTILEGLCGGLGVPGQFGVSVCLCVFVDARLQQLIPTTNSVLQSHCCFIF